MRGLLTYRDMDMDPMSTKKSSANGGGDVKNLLLSSLLRLLKADELTGKNVQDTEFYDAVGITFQRTKRGSS